MKIAVASFAVLSIAASLVAIPARAETLVFMLDNQSSGIINEFYASPVGVDNWEEDILGEDVLDVGASTRITITDSRDVCEYDLRVVFDGGDNMEDRAVDLCETGSYTVSD